MENDKTYRVSYSAVKPAVAFGRKHWSIPDVHIPWKGFEDKTPDKKLQLKAVRRQVFNAAKFFLSKGESPASVVEMLHTICFPKED